MSKLESSLKNMVITLLVITVVAGGALGYIYQLTKEPIEMAAIEKQQEAIQVVVPEFDNNPAEEVFELTSESGAKLNAFPAKMGGELVGVAVESVSNKGFAGEVKIMVGFKPDGTVIDYQILDHQETPGLGTKMDDWFKPKVVEEGKSRNKFFDFLYGIKESSGSDGNNIVGKNPGENNLTVTNDGGEVDAITAATITSRAFLDAVNIAYKAFINDFENEEEQSIENKEEGGTQ